MNIKTIAFGGALSMPWTAEITLLFLRIYAGLAMALAHGLRKVPPSEGFIGLTGDLGFPIPTVFAWAAGLSELVGGLLLAAGLFTRPAAFFLVITMGVAFYAHIDDPFDKMEKALLFFFTFLPFIFIGAGRTGVDRALR